MDGNSIYITHAAWILLSFFFSNISTNKKSEANKTEQQQSGARQTPRNNWLKKRIHRDTPTKIQLHTHTHLQKQELAIMKLTIIMKWW